MASKIYGKVKNFLLRKQQGASMGEYAVLLAIVTIALVGVITAFSGAISGVFTSATSTMNTAAGSGS
jgi:pilus assembly protein Flp/PilA